MRVSHRIQGQKCDQARPQEQAEASGGSFILTFLSLRFFSLVPRPHGQKQTGSFSPFSRDRSTLILGFYTLNSRFPEKSLWPGLY